VDTPPTREFTVPSQLDGARLDRIVAALGEVSRRIARTWISAGRVRIGGRVVRVLSRELRAGRKLQIQIETEQPPPTEPSEEEALQILFADRWLVAVNKPAGLLSESGPGRGPSVESRLPAELLARGERGRVWLVHRLDAGTSGVLLLARTPQATARLADSFRQGEVKKTYLALCSGELARRQEINQPIGRVRGSRHGVVPGGKPSATLVEPLATGAAATLVRATPRTGRTHQIRVHLAHLGHPLLGDGLYGGPRYDQQPIPRPIPRPMLHAAAVTFPHPKSGRPQRLAVAAPHDFIEVAGSFGITLPGDL